MLVGLWFVCFFNYVSVEKYDKLKRITLMSVCPVTTLVEKVSKKVSNDAQVHTVKWEKYVLQ